MIIGSTEGAPEMVARSAASCGAREGLEQKSLWNSNLSPTYSKYQRHYVKDVARVLVWQASTSDMNPGIDPAIIAEAYEDDPESAASEYGAEFRTVIADFISRAIVEACVEPGCFERPYARAAGKYSAFIDAAGGSGTDSMTLAISHASVDGPVLAALRERRPPFSPDDCVNEFTDLMRTYCIRSAESDKWGGDWVGEAFRKRGITVKPCAKPKSDLYREALPLLNARRCNLIEHPKMVSQLCALERRTARGGRDSIDHPPNGHDDVANAAVGALLMAGLPIRQAIMVPLIGF